MTNMYSNRTKFVQENFDVLLPLILNLQSMYTVGALKYHSNSSVRHQKPMSKFLVLMIMKCTILYLISAVAIFSAR